MKKIIKSFLLLITSFQMYGQVEDIENLMTRRYLSCNDIAYNVSFLIPEYYEKGNKDTLKAIMTYWEEQCGISEELIRFKILLSIDDGSFSESLYRDNILRMLREYERNNTYYGRYNNNFVRLNKFTVELSKTLLETKKISAVESFFLRIYANDFDQPLFEILEFDEFNGTRIKELYHKENKAREQAINFHNAWMLGVWIPQGNLELLGVHPFFGYRAGVKYKKLTADLALGIKFINSPNTYQVYKDGVIWDTDYFGGVYLGLDGGFELFRFGKNSIDIIGGIAYENINTLNEKNENCCECCTDNNKKISHNLESLNLNIGLGYKFYFKKQRHNQRYLGVDFKYNFVNFKNPHGTNLDGNVFTVNLIIGNVIGGLFSNYYIY